MVGKKVGGAYVLHVICPYEPLNLSPLPPTPPQEVVVASWSRAHISVLIMFTLKARYLGYWCIHILLKHLHKSVTPIHVCCLYETS